MTRSQARATARKLYAAAILARTPTSRNTAGSVEAGYSNLWIEPAIDAIADLVLRLGDEDEDPEDRRP